MIMNYPKDDIKSIMNDAMFLENLNILKKNADKNQKIPVKNVYTTESYIFLIMQEEISYQYGPPPLRLI